MSLFVRYIGWHLERSRCRYCFSKETGVFWIERGAGGNRDAIKEGVLMWNLAFERQV